MSQNCQKHSCAVCPMRATTEWADLGTEELALLDQHKFDRDYRAGEVLFRQGERNNGVYCIHSGLVGLKRLDRDGNTVLVRMAHPGETVGYRSFLKQSDHILSAEVLVAGHVCRIERSIVSRLLATHPDLGLRFLRHSLEALADTEQRFVQSRTWPARARLLHTLLIFNERLGKPGQDGSSRLTLPVARRELAAIIGTTPEAISRLVRDLQNEGLAHFDGRAVEIPSVDELLNSLPVLE